MRAALRLMLLWSVDTGMLLSSWFCMPGRSATSLSRSKSVSRAVSAKRSKTAASFKDDEQVEKAKKLKKVQQRELIRMVCIRVRVRYCVWFGWSGCLGGAPYFGRVRCCM
jgi:hypothetical protein